MGACSSSVQQAHCPDRADINTGQGSILSDDTSINSVASEKQVQAVASSSCYPRLLGNRRPIEGPQLVIEKTGSIHTHYALQAGRNLGEGAFGKVVRGVHCTTNEARAVKQISRTYLTDIRLFRQEVDISRRLDHPNVIRLHETFEDRTHVYLVMELCEGGELFDRLQQQRRFCELEASRVMQDVLRAVRYMHGIDVTHRDLKPENILLQSRGPISGNVMKLIDFGTARSCHGSQKMSTKVGTSYYVAPQVLQRRYGRECDLWSAGVLVFVLLSGSPPFGGRNDDEILRKVRKGTFSFDRPVWNTVSAGAKDLVRMLMHMNPQARYSAEQALRSDWLAKTAPARQATPLQEGDVERLRSFASQGVLRRAAMQVVARQLKETNLRRPREQFVGLDADSNGLISVEEMRHGMEQSGVLRSVSDLHHILTGMCGAEMPNQIRYTDFVAAAIDADRHLDKEACWGAFNVFDLDGDGRITALELERVLGLQGLKARSEAKSLVQVADTDGDGELDFSEFTRMLKDGGRPAGINSAPDR